MTLFLQVSNTKQLPLNCVLYVEGSRAGPLISLKGQLNAFKVTCSKLDILTIKLFDEQFNTISQGKLLGQVFFSAARFISYHKYNPKLCSQQTQYETTLFNRNNDQSIGTVTFKIKYNKGQLYQGENVGVFQSLPSKEPVRIYKGSCDTNNIFSAFDQGNQHMHFNLVEKIYRDDTWDL